MELWIRSQNKEKLMQIDTLYTSDEINDGREILGANIHCTNRNLGTYATKERALEVLDEIQGIIIAKYMSDINFKAAFSRIGNEKSAEYLLNQMAVYEMPKE